MPITVNVPGREFFDPETNEFVEVKPTVLTLEHSLLSITKWESKWHKPYLSKIEKTREETIDYIRCMSLTPNIDPLVYKSLTDENVKLIISYIEDPMTATTFSKREKKASREVVTNELIYYWMTALNIPFDPCQKWHLSRLLTLIEVCSIKNSPPKKMSNKDVMKRNRALNAQRRAKHHSLG